MPKDRRETPRQGQSPADDVVFLGLDEEPEKPEEKPEENPEEPESVEEPGVEQNTQPGEEQQETAPAEEEKQGEQLIAGKFKSYDDVVKAYKELERKLGQITSERKQLEQLLQLQQQQLELLQQRQQQQQPPQPQQQIDESKYLDMLLTKPASTIKSLISEEVERLRQEITIEKKIVEKENQYRNSLGDIFEKIKPQLNQYIAYYRQHYPQSLVDGSGYDFAVKTLVGELAMKGELNTAPPASPPRVETTRPSRRQGYSPEVLEVAKKLNIKPEQAQRYIEAVDAGIPIDLETLSPKEEF